MCVEYLENLLHEDSYNFDIPELEVRPDSVPVPEISEQMDISDAPPLCESRSGDETEEVINLLQISNRFWNCSIPTPSVQLCCCS